MIKKCIWCIIYVLVICEGYVVASDVRTLEQGNQRLVTWDFETEVGNSIGFNLDNLNPGMIGVAKLSLTTDIAPEHTEVFDTLASVRGTIRIEDFEIKSYIDEATLKGDSETIPIPISISWGDIEGSIFIHAFYVQFNANKHDRIDLIDSLDDADLDFSVINYSIIPLQNTAIYKGSSSQSVGDILSFEIDEVRGVVGRDFIEQGNSSLMLGYIIANTLDLRLGISTKYDYLQNIESQSIAMSFYARYFLSNFSGFDYFQVVFKSALSVRPGEYAPMDKGHPLKLGVSVQYKVPIRNGDFFLIPTLGFEAELENLRIVNPDASFETRRVIPSKNDWIVAQKYEGVAGVIFDWSSKGRLKHKDDHLNFRSGSQDKVTDGVSLTIGFGYVPNEIFRKLQTPYAGIKLAFWDSEDQGIQGILSNIQLGLIINLNHTFGGLENNFHHYIDGYETAPGSVVFINQRTDLGIGIQFKYRIFIFEPYMNAIWKQLDIYSLSDKYEVKNNFLLDEKRIYPNKVDFRVKIGTVITGVMNYLDFDIGWESGDMIKSVLEEGPISDEDYFSNENTLGDKIFVSHARLGFVSVGATIKF